MNNAKERVELELSELKTRQLKLDKFINSTAFDNVSGPMQELMTKQFFTQSDLIVILQTRLANWNK